MQYRESRVKDRHTDVSKTLISIENQQLLFNFRNSLWQNEFRNYSHSNMLYMQSGVKGLF